MIGSFAGAPIAQLPETKTIAYILNVLERNPENARVK